MRDHLSNQAELLARHLDGQLSAEDTAKVERLVRESPEARAQLEAMRRIDESLIRSFKSAAAPTSIDPTRTAPAAGPRRMVAIVRNIAAAILIGALAGWFLWPAGQWPKSSSIPRTVDAFYDHEVDRGFTPDAVCTDDAQFQAFTALHVGTALMADADPEVQILGWGYPRDVEAMGLPTGTVSLLCRVGTDDVLVLMTPDGSPASPRKQWFYGHHVHRLDLGGITMVEISRRTSPRVLPLIRYVPCPENLQAPAPE